MSITSTGRVYKIVARQSNVVYIGSTFNRLSDRWNNHKSNFRAWIADKSRDKCSIYPHFEEHGIDQYKIILIKEYQVLDRRHLEAYETLWINRLRCVNKNSPFQISRLYQAAYYDANRKQLIEKAAAYRESHRAEINEKAAIHYAANRDMLIEKAAAYRESHRAEIRAQQNVKHACDCGGRYTNSSRRKHERTAKHQEWLSSQA